MVFVYCIKHTHTNPRLNDISKRKQMFFVTQAAERWCYGVNGTSTILETIDY